MVTYCHTYGWTMIPKGWKVTRGAQGFDGSGAISFAFKVGHGHLIYWTAGVCLGCVERRLRSQPGEERVGSLIDSEMASGTP